MSHNIYNPGFGPLGPNDISGSFVEFRPDGSFKEGFFGDDFRFDWIRLPNGDVIEAHAIDQGYPKGDPRRYITG